MKGHGSEGTRHGSEEGVLLFAKLNFSKPQALVPWPSHRLKERMMTLQSVSEKGLRGSGDEE